MTCFCLRRRLPVLMLLGVTLLLANSGRATFAQKGKKKDTPSPYFQLKPGEFPAEGTATAIGGELIAVDRINRTGVFRLDRTDAQSRAHWDLPVSFTMLPYGSLRYHGAPAELRDIPLGTHLHGLFFWDDAVARSPQTLEKIGERRISPQSGFHWVLRFEDDFSFFRRQNRAWRIDAIDREKMTLTTTAVGTDGSSPDARAEIFQINPATRVWKGNGFGSLDDLKAGDRVLMNFTYRTMKLSGRCTDVWLDEESQTRAAARQREVHRLYQREHGLAGWIDAVDDKARTLTVTLFDGFDPALKEDFKQKAMIKDVLMPPFVAVAAAEASLRAYDPINDIKRAPILAMKSVPLAPGCSGWQLTVQPDLMLEGFRLKRIVRLYAGIWGVTDLPREEKLFP
jgi:hypothetical protein